MYAQAYIPPSIHRYDMYEYAIACCKLAVVVAKEHSHNISFMTFVNNVLIINNW